MLHMGGKQVTTRPEFAHLRKRPSLAQRREKVVEEEAPVRVSVARLVYLTRHFHYSVTYLTNLINPRYI